MQTANWRRTVVIILAGVVLSVAVPALLEYVIQPESGPLIRRAIVAPPNSPEWRNIGPLLRRSAIISTFLIAPLGGLVVGAFVGLFQKHYVSIISVICVTPEFVESLLADHQKVWASSESGILHYIFHRSLPVLAAVASAIVCRTAVSRKDKT